MKITDFKHTLLGVIALLAMSLCMASCISDDETTETSPECVITSFAVGKITSYVTEKEYDKDGNEKDVIKTKSILGTDIKFNIDQVNGHIYTTDSLPYWVDLTKVSPSFVCYGNLWYKIPKEDDLYYTLTSGSDSIDASKTATLVCVASDGVSSKTYKLDIYKRKQATDTLIWKSSASDLSIVGSSRLYHNNGKVMAFAKDGNGKNVTTCTADNDGTAWSVPAAIPVESSSIIQRNGTFYGIDSNGTIYSSSGNDATTWEKASDRQVDRLLAADGSYIYALDDNSIIGTADMSTWSIHGTENIDMLPDNNCNFFYYKSKTNEDISIAVMTGLSASNSNNGVAWFKQTSTKSNANMPWAYIEVTTDNIYGLPHLGCMSTTRYEESLYVLGTENGAYKHLYRSDDNGISWHELPGKYPLPAELTPQGGAASMIAVGSTLWIIQENGKIWKGSIL